jgi:hypothetical protein
MAKFRRIWSHCLPVKMVVGKVVEMVVEVMVAACKMGFCRRGNSAETRLICNAIFLSIKK